MSTTGPQIVSTTSSRSSGAPLTWIVSVARSNGRGPSGVRYASAFLGSGSSTTRSAQSPWLFVKPQATWPLLPTTTKPEPGSITPVTRRSAPAASNTSEARYQVFGTPRPRCMSSASSAPPWVVWLPATAQLLLP